MSLGGTAGELPGEAGPEEARAGPPPIPRCCLPGPGSFRAEEDPLGSVFLIAKVVFVRPLLKINVLECLSQDMKSSPVSTGDGRVFSVGMNLAVCLSTPQ